MITVEPLPNSELTDLNNEQVIAQLLQLVEERIQRRDLMREDVHQKQNNFRNILVELEREKMSLKRDNVSMKESNEELRNVIFTLEGRVYKLQSQIDSLIYKLNNAHEVIQNMQQELRYRDRQLKQHTTDKQKIIEKCNATIQAETDRIVVELEAKLREQREQFERCIKKKDDKLNLMKQILVNKSEDITCAVSMTSPTAANTRMDIVEEPVTSTEGLCMNVRRKSTIPEEPIATTSKEKSSSELTDVNSEILSTSATADTVIPVSKPKLKTNVTRMSKIPVVNPRYRRSQNADRWINHYPAGIVPTGTILQPEIAPCRQTCLTKLTNPKTFATKSIKYCLYSQEQDTDGELETKLYKADVLPTSGGGAQIVFNDVECLKQLSPTRAKRRNGQINPENSPTLSCIDTLEFDQLMSLCNPAIED
ncbi:Kinesin-like protein KIF23 [Ooceraea biroi]|uniref:Kinesin-like protein KIF23 n=1 Tax=Ooceraea biroi TaxID=2015173 RepID=A0A026W1Y5_OOCBI|nr:Kinesin-like protein KIF23 [Ooceraea biroi]